MRAWISHALMATGALALLSHEGHAARPTAGSVSPERLKLPSSPSSVRGLADEPSVTARLGAIAYEVPLELPAGLGNLAPAIALAYDGSLGNGPLGIGWTLAETKIVRSTRLGPPTFGANDTLEISGIANGRLVSIGGDEYRVEGLGQTVRVRRVDAGFEVDDGKGIHFKLGTTAASRQDRDATSTLEWRIEEQTNLMGERIAYEYIHDRGQLYLAAVTWGPDAIYHVTFGYEDRPDTTTSFRPGFRVDTAKRIGTIEVRAAGVVRRSYQLGYDDENFPVTRLVTVDSTGVAGAGAWPRLTFDYASTEAPALHSVNGIGTWRLNSSGTTLADLDGDGAADLLQVAAGGNSYLTNHEGTFGDLQTLGGIAPSLAEVQLQDIDGDGRVDLLQDTGNGWSVYKFARTAWVAAGTWPGSSGLALKKSSTTRFADLNGDGLVDVMQWDNDNLKVHFATRTAIGPAVNMPRIGGTNLPATLGRFQDVNGDGLDDYILVATDHLDVFIGHGDGSFEPRHAISYPFAGSISSAEDIEIADLDRDGLVDLMRIEVGDVRWFRGTANGGFESTSTTLANPETLSSTVVVAVADMNGNGSQDVVWSSTSGVWYLDLAGTKTAGMLTHVDNGLGLRTAFQYASSHSLSVADTLAGNPWQQNIPIALPVVVAKTSELGPGEVTREIDYRVRNAFWDPIEQRFAGFLNTIVTTHGATPAETGVVYTTYSAGTGTNRELRGVPTVIQVKDGTGKVLSFTAQTWQALQLPGWTDPLLRRPVLKEVATQHEDATPTRLTDVKYEYDALGRQIRSVDQGLLDLDGDEKVTTTSYGDDDANWIRDQVCDQTVSDLSGTAIASRTQKLYGDDLAIQPLCVIGKGWPRETRAWLDREARFITQESAAYDSHGNPIELIKGGVTRRMVYDADGLFPIEEHVTGERELVWTAVWDAVGGAMTSLTDPDGHVTHVSYDALGRYASTAIDDHAPHQVVEYDWSAPFPKTTTWTYDGTLADVGERPATWTADSHWRQSVEVTNGKGEVRYHAVRLADSQWILSDYRERDPNSRVVFAGRPVYVSQLAQEARPAGMSGDTLRYDPLGRLIEQRLPTGQARTYTYSAFERTVQDADLALVHSSLDGAGRPILTERTAGAQHESVRATYDAAGRMTKMTLADGAVVRDFAYDSLGRLREMHDPDLGARTLTWDDGDRLLTEVNGAGQTTSYTYDALGRLASRDTGAVSRFHYDRAREGTAATNLGGRLAWVEEPTGVLETSYDELGRQVLRRHQIDDKVSTSTSTFATSGELLGHAYDDGFALSYRYDAAGRLVEIPGYWQILEQDASGEPLHELAANGVDTRYERDVLNQTARISMRDASSNLFYDVAASRDGANNLVGLTDNDGIGLDHTASFSYDPFSRLVGATIGQGANQFAFSYQYDVLHNMTSRTQTGPRELDVFTGAYRYGENTHAPRQLTSIVDTNNQVTHTFDYDAAGRQIAEDGRTMIYDASDRLVAVNGVPGGSESHAYDANGDRIKTVQPDGSVSYFFGDGTADRNGAREHDVAIGGRTVARVVIAPESGAGAGGTFPVGALVVGGLGAAMIAALALSMRRRREAALRWAVASFATVTVGACASSTGTHRQALENATTTFLHNGYGAGPLIFTNASGSVSEERRYEAFGAAIDAAATSTLDLGELGKRVDRATGWSDHGARWMQPEVARWTSTDPPVQAPGAKFMAEPWALHPYQYVNSNPVAYWDPDGREPRPADSTSATATTANAPTTGAEPPETEETGKDELIEWAGGFFLHQDSYWGEGMEYATRPLTWDWSEKLWPGANIGKYEYLIVSPIAAVGGGAVSLLYKDLIQTPYHLGHGLYRTVVGPDEHAELLQVHIDNGTEETSTRASFEAYGPKPPETVEWPNSEPVYWDGDQAHAGEPCCDLPDEDE